jgi:hypothetical protein
MPGAFGELGFFFLVAGAADAPLVSSTMERSCLDWPAIDRYWQCRAQRGERARERAMESVYGDFIENRERIAETAKKDAG